MLSRQPWVRRGRERETGHLLEKFPVKVPPELGPFAPEAFRVRKPLSVSVPSSLFPFHWLLASGLWLLTVSSKIPVPLQPSFEIIEAKTPNLGQESLTSQKIYQAHVLTCT